MRQHSVLICILTLFQPFLSPPPLTTAKPVAISISSPPLPPTLPQPPASDHHHPNIVHHNLLLTRSTHTLRNGYTVRFTAHTALQPIRIAATALTLWYRSLLNTLMLPRTAPQVKVFNRPFGFHTTYMRLDFLPSAPNLASRAMVYAFVEWLQERAERGAVEFFEAVIEGPWGRVEARLGLADGYTVEGLGIGVEGGGEASGSGSGAGGGAGAGAGDGGEASGSGSGSDTESVE